MKTIKEYSEQDIPDDITNTQPEEDNSTISKIEDIMKMVDDIYETVLSMEEHNPTIDHLVNRMYAAVDDVYVEIDKNCGITPAPYDEFEIDDEE